MFGEGSSWFHSFMKGKQPENEDQNNLDNNVNNDEESKRDSEPTSEQIIEKLNKRIKELEYILEMRQDEEGDLTHKKEQKLRFQKRLLEWKIELMKRENSGNTEREWNKLRRDHNINRVFTDFCEKLAFHPNIDSSRNAVELNIFDDLDTDPMVEVNGRKVTGYDDDGIERGMEEKRLLLRYLKNQERFEIIDEIPDGYKVADVHPFGEFVILANLEHTDLNNVDNEYFRADFGLYRIDENAAHSLQPVMEFSPKDGISEYFRKKHSKIWGNENRINDKIFMMAKDAGVHVRSEKRKDHKKILEIIQKIIAEEKKTTDTTFYKTTRDFLWYYNITKEEQEQLGIIIDEEMELLKEHGHSIAIGGLAFAEDGSSIVRLVQTRTAHRAFAAYVIPMENLAAGNSPKPENVRIEVLEGRGIKGALFKNYNKKYTPSVDFNGIRVEKKNYLASKKLGNKKIEDLI